VIYLVSALLGLVSGFAGGLVSGWMREKQAARWVRSRVVEMSKVEHPINQVLFVPPDYAERLPEA
jgi:hypothetical protein